MRRIRTFLLIPLMLSMLGASCLRAPSAEVTKATKPVTLNWWTVYNDSESLQGIISAYRTLHPNVTVNVKVLRSDEYEQTLLDALAEDRGPDIFSLHNTWIGKYQSKLVPIPDSYTIPFTTVQGTIKKEQVTELKTIPGLTINKLQNQFVDVVASDVVRKADADVPQQQGKDRIYALPLSTDTLALFYNKDLLNAANIAQPPRYWTDFQSDIKKLTKQDAQGNIIQSGAGMGTAKNVARYADILSLLMMQNGTKMTDSNGLATFDKVPAELSGLENPPGADAAVFYTDFANPTKEVYTWNEKMPDSMAAFAQGKSAFFLGYSFNIPQIRAAAPKLNFGIAQAPQIEQNPVINYANYWVEGVSKKSANQNWAWDFLTYATGEQQAGKFLDAAKRPTALRALIQRQLDDLDLSAFAQQALTAKSWYHGKNEAGYETAFAALINNILSGAKVSESISNAVNQVNETLR